MTKKRVGEQLIDILEDMGHEFFFGVSGTEFAPIIERFFEKGENSKLKPVTVPHEYLAVNMAYGAYLVTQKPQVVMVHTSIGTLNAAAAIMNAERMRIPMIVIAGRTPTHEYDKVGARDLFIHWAQETYDQAASLREFLKWDYELRDPHMLKDVLTRAHSIAMEEPRGPVYLTIPRELLLEDVETIQAHTNLIIPPPASSAESNFKEIAQLINDASRPIIVTKSIGESFDGYKAFEEFCDYSSVPCFFPDAHYCNLRWNHSMNFGYRPDEILQECDLVISLDMDVPWIPSKTRLNPNCQIVHIGPEPLFNSIPIRSFPQHKLIKSNSTLALKEIKKYIDKTKITNRADWTEKLNTFKKNKKNSSNNVVLNKENISQIIGNFWQDDLILINELALPIESIPFHHFGSYYRTGSASGLGWAGGCALGLSLANKDKILLNVVGDGAYYFTNPLAYHWVAQAYKLPIITIILNNSGMHSIAKNTALFFKNKNLSQLKNLPLLNLSPSLKFEELAKTFDGLGFVAHNNSEFASSLSLALNAARKNKTQTVINTIILD